MDDFVVLSRFLEAVGSFVVVIEVALAIGIFSTLMYIILQHKTKQDALPKVFCSDCGARLKEPSYYCVECGSKQ